MKRYMSGVWEHTVYICANRDRLGLYAELQISFGIVCAVTVKTQFTYCKKISRKGRYSSIRVETVQKKWYEIKKCNTKIVFEFTKPKQTSKRIWIFQKLQCVRKLIIKSAKTALGCTACVRWTRNSKAVRTLRARTLQVTHSNRTTHSVICEGKTWTCSNVLNYNLRAQPTLEDLSKAERPGK